MSTPSRTFSSFLTRSALRDDPEEFRIEQFSRSRGTLANDDSPRGYRVRVDHRPQSAAKKANYRVLRRFNGFVIAFDGKDALVMLIENDQQFPYQLPAERLEKEGIKVKNQPFQMDEVETQTELGTVTGYAFRPLAKASDAYVQTLPLAEESKRKRDLILSKFAKP